MPLIRKPILTVLPTLILPLAACGKKEDKTKIQVAVTAQTLAGVGGQLVHRMLADPSTETGGYEGIGVNYGDSVVDGLKMKVTDIQMAGVPGVESNTPVLDIFNWADDPKELALEEGLNEKLQQTVEIEAKEGNYAAMTVSFRNAFSVKAYAYLDANNDGTIDTTIYTTAAGITKVGSKLAKADFTGYDYYDYKAALVGAASSLDASNETFGITTIFPSPVAIAANGEVTTKTEDGQDEVKKTASLSVDLAIDTYRIVKVWDGRYGTSTSYVAGNGSIPSPVYPFPQGDNDSRTLSGGLHTYDFYPPGQPAFGLGDYIATYAFPNMSSIKTQVYLVSKDGTFNPFNIQVFTLITDESDVPLIGKFSLGEGEATLHIGMAARLFSKADDGSFTFATSGGTKNSSGVDDGGLFYNNDITAAGHIFKNFKLLDTVGASGTMLMTDGPRCKDAYDYCVGADGRAAYYKRVK